MKIISFPRTATFCLVLTSVMGMAGTAHAAYITQSSASDTLIAFEAENYQQISSDPPRAWAIATDANASGGVALVAQGPSSGAGSSDNDAFVTYNLRFLNDGDYRIYFRYIAPDGNSNSVYVSTALDLDPTAGTGFVDLGTNGTPTTYAWKYNLHLIVSESQLGSVHTFTAKVRESNYILDRIIIAQTSGINATTLNNTPNSTIVIPEPATLALLCLGGLMLIPSRKHLMR